MSDELNWDHTNRIGVLLTDAHPKTEPHTVALSELHGYVTALSNFKGGSVVVFIGGGTLLIVLIIVLIVLVL